MTEVAPARPNLSLSNNSTKLAPTTTVHLEIKIRYKGPGKRPPNLKSKYTPYPRTTAHSIQYICKLQRLASLLINLPR